MTGRTTIPDENVAPEVGKTPSHQEELNNLAGDEELCKEVVSRLKSDYQHYDTQQQRINYTHDGGIMDMADRMLRVSLEKDTTSKQNQNTLSNVASTLFFRQHKTMNASMNAILFTETELPAKYLPELSQDVESIERAKSIALQRNLLEEYTWDEDRRTPKLKDFIFFLLKYGNGCLYHEWDLAREKRTRRVKTAGGTDFITRVETIRDWPTVRSFDMKDVWSNAQIADSDKQQSTLARFQDTLGNLYVRQASGKIMNVGKLRSQQLYQGESDTQALERREKNASGDGVATEPTGLMDLYICTALLPITENTVTSGKKKGQKNGKGKWDEEKNPPVRYQVLVGGSLPSGNPVCLQIVRDDALDGASPFKFIHAIRDDKGLYHMGWVSILKDLHWQASKNINQAFDSVDMRNNAPWICDGQLNTRDLTFRVNKLIWKGRGTTLERLKIEDTTTITLDMAARIEEEANEVTGANKPIRGEALGARTSAQESRQVFDSAQLPIVGQADYIAEQIFNWLLMRDALSWELRGDPKTIRFISRSTDEVVEIKPSHLIGQIKTKVVAVAQTINSIAEKQEVNNFLANVLPAFSPFLEKKGVRVAVREGLKRSILRDKALEIAPDVGEYDAEMRQRKEIGRMGLGDFVEPSPEENHDAHIVVLEPAIIDLELNDEDDVAPLLSNLRRHKAMHEELRTQQQAALGGGQQGQPQEGTPAELASNPVEAREGSQAQLV